MDYEEQSLTFEEVDYYYLRLKELQNGRVLRDEEFGDLLKRLMVRDETGRWWAKSSSSGDWHYYDGNSWVKGVPPREESKSSVDPEPSIRKLSMEELVHICSRYDGSRFYVGYNVPKLQVTIIRALFGMPYEEGVAAWLDTSSRKVKNVGLAICEDGIRWRSMLVGAGEVENTLAWRDFVDVDIQQVGGYQLQIGDRAFMVDKGSMDPSSLCKLLTAHIPHPRS